MLVKKKLRNYYFKFWHLKFKQLTKNAIYKNYWLTEIIKKNSKNGKQFVNLKFWYKLLKSWKKNKITALPFLLKGIFNLNFLVGLASQKKKNFQSTFPILFTFNQRFFLNLKQFFKGVKSSKKIPYYINIYNLLLKMFSKRSPLLRTNFLYKYLWNIKRFFGKNNKNYKVSFKKFNFNKITKKWQF